MNSKILNIDDLPTELPLLPVYGVVLMPRAILPVPILEKEYIKLLSDTLSKGEEFVAVVQPLVDYDISLHDKSFSLFSTGCLAKVVDIIETEEDRYVVTLVGICRFDIVEDIENNKLPYRSVVVDYSRYSIDLAEEVDFNLDRKRLLSVLKPYFKAKDMVPNWQEIDHVSNEKLVTALTMVCPLEANEKQALLEEPSLEKQSRLLTALIEHALFDLNNPSSMKRIQ